MSQRQIMALGAVVAGLMLGWTAASGDAVAGEAASREAVSGGASPGGTAAGGAAAGEAPTQIIKINARKFEFTPQLITLKRNVPYLLQITTTDRSHGFNIPSMHLRADVEPGKIAEVKVTPTKTGTYEFYCDIFCGSGHEDMSGQLKVTE